MIVYASRPFEPMGGIFCRSSAQIRCGKFRAARFANGELFIQVDTPPAGQDCAILASIAPPDDQMLSTFLLAHTLRKEGARRITGVFPYLAYSRQDKNKQGQSLAAAWIGSVAFASGFDEVLTVDVHSPDDERLFQVPLESVSPAPIFAAALNEHRLSGATIIAPDHGAVSRCEAIRAAAGLAPAAISWFEKHRAAEGIEHTRFIGEVGTQAVLIDDILDTGATLISACQRLFLAGVEDIQIMVTHGLFTGDDWQRLWGFGVSRIYCTDTVPRPAAEADPRIVTLSAAPLLATALSR